MHDHTRVPALVNETEAARILDISVKTLRRWRWAGEGPIFTSSAPPFATAWRT
jgi:hypothetical protein